jgi:hypothetical protein
MKVIGNFLNISRQNMDKEFSLCLEILAINSENKLIKGIGMKIVCRDMVYITTQMDQLIEENGNQTSTMEKESINLQMEQYFKVNGIIIKCMELDIT